MQSKYKFSIAVCALLLAGQFSFGQQPMMNDQGSQNAPQNTEAVNQTWLPSLVEDGIIDRVPHDNKILPIHKIREIDVAWQTTVWRIIDIHQKQNQAFSYVGDEFTGGGAFIEILNDAIRKGKVRAYANVDDRFTTPVDVKDFNKLLGIGDDTIMVSDPITGEETQKIIHNEFNVNTVNQFEVMEKWIFDRNRGRMVVQLVGIAPLKDQTDDQGNYLTSTVLYWVYYPELRKILGQYEVYNPLNDMHRMTWTDYLDGHMYASYVIKTSLNNPTGRFLPHQNTPEGLAQGQALLNDIINREMDMWEE